MKMNSKKIAFGDIHGCFEAAATAIQLAQNNSVQAIFLGDYVDRGSDSMKTLRLLIDAKQANPDWVFLRGNHDQMLLDVIHGKRIVGDYDSDTYEQTLPAFKAKDADFQKEVIDFLESTQFYYETNEFIFVHALLKDDNKVMLKKIPNDLMWSYDSIPEWTGKPFIHGHYNTEHIKFTPNSINLNTSCGYGGKLTGLMIDEGKPEQFDVFEISEEGKRLKEFSVINTDLQSFRKFDGKTFFYPACGMDIIDPIAQCPEIDTFVFNDVRNDAEAILNLLQQHFQLQKVVKRVLHNIQINGYVTTMNFVLYEMALKTKNGRQFKIVFIVGKGYAVFEYFFRQLDNSLDLFYYRGDGMGEGGSGMIWFKKIRFRPLIEKLTQYEKTGVIITDGSNHCDFKTLEAWRYRSPYAKLKGKEFTYHAYKRILYKFTPVKYLGKYNSDGVVKWEVKIV